MKTLTEIQNEIGKWSQNQFGDNISKVTGQKLFSQAALTGLVEEVGELNGVTIKHHQGRRGYSDQAKYEADRNDAIADILVFLCDYAFREGVDLMTVLEDTWTKVVSKRTTQNWAEHTHEGVSIASQVGVANTIGKPTGPFIPQDNREQTGQGFSEPVDDNSYTLKCSKCGKKIHSNNSTGLCPDCYSTQEARKGH